MLFGVEDFRFEMAVLNGEIEVSVIKMEPTTNGPVVYCGSCRAQLWYKGGDFINDGIWCPDCSSWNEARDIKLAEPKPDLERLK